MDEVDDSPCKNVYIDVREKYRRFSGLVEKTHRLHSKRFKKDTEKEGDNLTSNKESRGLNFVDEIDELQEEPTTKIKLVELSKQFQNNLNVVTNKDEDLVKERVGRSCKKSSQKDISFGKVEESPKIKKYNRKANTDVVRYKNENTDISAREKEKTSSTEPGKRRREQRRLSGLYKPDLNMGFIEEHSWTDEEISPKEKTIPFIHVFNEEPGLVGRSQDKELASKNGTKEELLVKEESKTPIKAKLRKKPKKEESKEEIIKYYTDKTIKKKQNSLETIFETPKQGTMSVRKYRRFINFNERMSEVKVRKRNSKIVKYGLWQNTDPVSMNYFVRKLEEVDEDM